MIEFKVNGPTIPALAIAVFREALLRGAFMDMGTIITRMTVEPTLWDALLERLGCPFAPALNVSGKLRTMQHLDAVSPCVTLVRFEKQHSHPSSPTICWPDRTDVLFLDMGCLAENSIKCGGNSGGEGGGGGGGYVLRKVTSLGDMQIPSAKDGPIEAPKLLGELGPYLADACDECFGTGQRNGCGPRCSVCKGAKT